MGILFLVKGQQTFNLSWQAVLIPTLALPNNNAEIKSGDGWQPAVQPELLSGLSAPAPAYQFARVCCSGL